MEIKSIWRWKAAESGPKQKTQIPKATGLLIMFLLGIIGVVAIMVILFDDYTASAWVSYSQIYWTSPPHIGRMYIFLMLVLGVIVGHYFIPAVYYIGPHGKPKFNFYLGWYMLDEDIITIVLMNGHKIETHKDRAKWYLFNIFIMGEYKYYVGDEKTTILESGKYEVSAANTLRKQLEAAEKEASLWQYKYMQLLENLQPYITEKKGGGDNGGD